MLKRIALWLLNWLRESLDTEFKAELDAYSAARAEQEQRIAELRRAQAAADIKLKQLEEVRDDALLEINLVLANIDALETKRAEIQREHDRKKAELDRLSDDAVLRSEL